MVGHDSEHRRSIAVSLLLTLVTCGLYNFYWQYLQMLAANEMLARDKYRFSSIVMGIVKSAPFQMRKAAE